MAEGKDRAPPRFTRVLTADADGIGEAARLLRDGRVVAVPTETVYGLAARADDAEAVAAIYAAKGRPPVNPLIVHVASLEEARRLAVFCPPAEALAAQHWPGALTLVLPRRQDAQVAPAVVAGLATIALRVPAHPVVQRLLRESGLALAAPSANPSGSLSPTTAAHVLSGLRGRIDAVLDGGPSGGGLESTIVAVRSDGALEELRPGPVVVADASAKLRGATCPAPIEAPGQMFRHYSPGKPLRLNALSPEPDEFYIAFAGDEGHCVLSRSGDLSEAAARLYACLHEAAAAPQPRIAIAPVPDRGVGRAINERLRRAAS
ncbi:threonylcarbamoyl-AMP synthase [Erythrobacteraceae bacterium CFH 75059]|uniref:L-threonylcarbamoyladenylate synthase n=1 Tax=Qipengyuania thermophila TaxID=2509361 RepID=UPI00102096ED|nr:L-threonylcarbamoyladenylate synthase [Qipengyuania thermophila]TCD06703.1 threonylcarbamoyl-AMP synthase [Erythrobacteraceae bacterium CFH 75059]